MSSFTEKERKAARQMTMDEFIEHYALDYFTSTEVAQYRLRHGIDSGDTNDHDVKRPSTRSFMSREKP